MIANPAQIALWRTKQDRARRLTRTLGLAHPLLVPVDQLPQPAAIRLIFADGIAATVDGAYMLLHARGGRRRGLAPVYILHRVGSDGSRSPVWRCEAWERDDAIGRANLWLAQDGAV